MITLKQFMEITKYQVHEAGEIEQAVKNDYANIIYLHSYPTNEYCISIYFRDDEPEVLYVEAIDYTRDRAYRLVNPKFTNSDLRLMHQAYNNENGDDVLYIELSEDDDWFEKASAIVDGNDYDERILISLNLSDEDRLLLENAAKVENLTVSSLIEKVLLEIVEKDNDGQK